MAMLILILGDQHLGVTILPLKEILSRDFGGDAKIENRAEWLGTLMSL